MTSAIDEIAVLAGAGTREPLWDFYMIHLTAMNTDLL